MTLSVSGYHLHLPPAHGGCVPAQIAAGGSPTTLPWKLVSLFLFPLVQGIILLLAFRGMY